MLQLLIKGQVVHCCLNEPNCDCFEISNQYQADMFATDKEIKTQHITPCLPGCMCYSCEARR